MNVRNCSVKTNSLMSVFSTGDYKMNLNIVDNHNESIGVINLVGSLKSSNTDTFG